MDKRCGRGWWQALSLRRRAPERPQPDFADLGTAFGLDASMSPAADFAAPFAERRAVDTATHLADRLHRRTSL